MMQYLKPEILARLRSLDDDVAEAAANEWEQAVARYNAELDAIRPILPAGVRTLHAHCSLHDARIRGILLASRRPRLSLLIQLEGRSAHPGAALELRYVLAGTSKHPGFTIRGHPVPERDVQDWGRIQYDEFSIVADAPVDVFAHSLLLRGEAELQIWFTEMQVRPLAKVILPSVEQVGLAMA
jgi:hypothetical protein